ncbi:MAG TPA: hypothetical protein PLV87_08405, partial [Opitutaceae bacterium]|nr:hypothetical protein [Opitutaceae bacterium]
LKCIVDPIDGTRGFMCDKRSAWVLTGLAPQRGTRTTLADIVVAVMTELPVVKQAAFDQLSAVRGQGVAVVRCPGLDRTGKRIRLRPSRARNFDHGFVSFSRFFPEGKTLLAEIEERFWRELKVWGREGGAKVFEDQYVSTGGQVYELIAGHDRLIADLRPLLPDMSGSGVRMTCCHPYDICTALILEELGGVVEDPSGNPLRGPLDTTTPVAWVGYANRTPESIESTPKVVLEWPEGPLPTGKGREALLNAGEFCRLVGYQWQAGRSQTSCQFSSNSPGTRANSRVLPVTRVAPMRTAWAAISMSNPPIS